MAILNHGSTLRTADGGQTTTTIVTAANIGTYGVATNSTYYVGTTQNIFNRASGAQTLTGVSIDGNAANITAYTINQNVGTANAPSFAGGTLTGELVVNYAAGRQRILDGANALIMGHWDTVNVRIEASGRPMYIVSYNGAISIGRSSGSNLVVDTASVSYGGNTVLHAGNYTSYPDATKLPLTGGTMSGTITGVSDSTISFNGGTCSAASYNYILSGGNDGGNKLVVFVNGTTRTADGGVNALTIRNDGGAFVLGIASYLTSILGSSVTINGNAALTSASTLTAGNLSGTIPSGVLGNSTYYVGTTAIALNRGSASQTLTGVSIDGSSASCTGNSATATILQTARNINGTSFNGSAAITTANWGTARTLTIGSTGKSVDGSAAVSWSLAELGAAATNQTMFVGTTSIAINRASASQTLTGVSIDGSAATVTTNANLTGHITSVGNATSLGSFTSAQLLAALTDETGTGANVFATSPTLVSPVLGTPSSGNLANCTFPTLNQNTTGSSASCTGNAATATYARRLDDASRTSFTVGGNKDNYYPVIFNIGSGATALQYSEFVIERGGYEEPGYTFAGGNTFSTLNIRFSCKSNGWGFGASYENVEMHGYTTQLVANWQQMSEASKLIVWLRGATIYYFWNVIANTTLYDGNSGGTSLTLANAPYYSYTYTSTQTVQTKALYGKYVNSNTGTSGIYVAGNVLAEGLFSGPGTGLTGTASSLSIGGNAATATILATGRLIGGVSFNGSADITLPGVNTGGTQNTTGSSASCTGNAATATTAAACSGNAATATILATARLIGGVSFNGSADITLPGVNTGGTQNTTGTSSNITAYTINQSVGTANSPTFVAVTTSTDGANHIMAGSANAEGIRMTPASSTTYPVFLRSINPGSGGEASPWIYKEQATDWGIWHNNPINTLDFTRATGTGIANNVGGSSTNTVVVRLDMATGTIQTSAGYLNRTGTTILDNSGNITGNAATVTNGVYTGTNNTLTGINTIYNTSNTVINNQSGNLGLTMYQATAGTDAYMTFHIGGDFAAYFGLGGAENDLVYGGWSVGNFRYRILHSSNAPYAWNMNQYVRTTDSPTFVTVTAALSGNAATATGQQSGVHFTLNTGGTGYGLVGVYNPSAHQGLFAMGAAYTLAAGGTLANFYGVSWTYDGSGYPLNTGYSTAHCLAVANAGTVYTTIGVGIWTAGLIRANGAISSGGTITAAAFSGPLTGNVTGNLTGNVTGAVSGNAGTVTNGLYTTGGQTIAGITYFSNGESMNVYGIRGRFTNEYLHLYNKVGVGHSGGWGQGETSTPDKGLSTYGGLNIAYGDNGISTFNGVIRANSNIRQGPDLARPLSSWSVSGTSTGMVIFSFPGNTSNYGMVHCVFDIYEYNSNTVSTVIVGGHNWNGAWYNTGANVIGRCGKSVRLGVKDSKYCVVFGGAASSWEYGTIVLRKIHNGGFYTGVMDMGGSFTTQQTATESFSNISGDLRALRTSADFIADGGISGTTGTFSGGVSGTTGTFSSDLSSVGNYQIRNGDPTITFRDTDHRTAYIHVNNNLFYILSGVADSAFGNWNIVANGRWPLEINLSNNNATFGADVNAISFTGAGTGLTGTATSLSIGGNAASASSLAADTSTRFKVITFTGEGGDSGNGNAATNYGIYQQGGSWTHPYPDLCIGFHTGIKIGAQTGYGGIRFYNTETWGTEIFSVGNGDNNVRVVNTIYAAAFSGPLTGNVTGNVTGNITGNVTGSSGSCTGNANSATSSGCVNSDTGNVGGSRLQYWQVANNATLNPDAEWYNAIRMGHGDPVTYYSNTLAVKMTGSNLGDIYTRTTTNGTAGTWNRFWNNNNDGSGSGLDADLLDGYNSATANTANTIVLRDGSGNFSAGTITASLNGNATNITAYTINQNLGTTNNVTHNIVDATQFRDSADPSYYIDLNGTSFLNTLRAYNFYTNLASVTSSASTTINTTFNVTELTLSASISTLTFSNIQSSSIVTMWTIVTIGNGSTYSITWPAAVKWPGGTAPTITATNAKRDIYQFVTYDGASNIYAIIVGQNL